MHRFRYNPLTKQWFLVGAPLLQSHSIKDSHILTIGQKAAFVAASYPHSPFELDPSSINATEDYTIYTEQPAVGEYELLLYKGELGFWDWTKKQWGSWLELVQQRLLQLHYNPHINFVSVGLSTSQLGSIESYQRVGDIIATSHPLEGSEKLIEPNLVSKILEKESEYTLSKNEEGFVQVPSAPKYPEELWYIPADSKHGIELISADERQHLAGIFHRNISMLHVHFPKDNFVIKIHTSLAGDIDGGSWWAQIYKDEGEPFLKVHSSPEKLLRILAHT